MNSLAVSGPYFFIISRGSTTLPLLLLMTIPSFSTIPWLSRLENGSSMVVSPVSLRALVKNLAYSRCRMACSIPPMYWSTGIQYSCSLSNGLFFSSGLQNLMKYQLLSTKVSMVSVSLLPFPPHFGHFAFTNFSLVSRGFPLPVNSTSSFSGSSTGRFFSGTGTIPHFLSQYMIGIGVPQYLCLLISQSRSL